jgi:serpin B
MLLPKEANMKSILMLSMVLMVGLACTSALAAARNRTAPAQSPQAARSEIAQAVDAFAVDLYGQVRGEKGNLFFSPYSISSALAMTYAGAKGETAAEMAKALHLAADQAARPEAIHTAYARLSAEFNAPGKPYALNIANSLWGQQGYGFLPDFLALLEKSYKAGLYEVDFAKDTEGARRKINAWVERETKDKIRDLVPAGALQPVTRLVLANAIYFKGTWLSIFEKKQTRDGDFFVPGGRKVKVPMMHQTEPLRHFDGGGFQALEMLYKSGDLSMIILLPKKRDGLADLEASLTAERLAEWTAKLQDAHVAVALPRFKMTWSSGLSGHLARMGMKLAFDPQKADFSPMNGGKEPLWIGQVIHKAFVDVNEEGTEAAAATAVVALGAAEPPKPVVFTADHPFLFLIRDVRSDCILFIGRVVNPAQSGE